MTRSLGAAVPDALAQRLDGSDPAAEEGFTPLLVTVDAEGWPHIALLSAGEVLIVDQRIRMALWARSTATEDLDRSGRGLVYAVVGDDALGLRVKCHRGPDIDEPGTRLATFECRVEDAFSDKVGYAELRSGITFVLVRPDRDLARWKRTISALRAMEPEAE
jgi:hypothetical protein